MNNRNEITFLNRIEIFLFCYEHKAEMYDDYELDEVCFIAYHL